MATADPTVSDALLSIGEVLLLPIVIWYLQVALHEVAHAIAGSLVGFFINSVRVGPVTVTRGAEGIVGIVQLKGATLFDGITYGLPVSVDGLRWRSIVFVAAGPVGTVAVTLLALWLSPNSPRMPWPTVVIAATGLLLSASSLLPFATRTGKPDMSRIVQLLATDTETMREWRYSAAVGILQFGEGLASSGIPFDEVQAWREEMKNPAYFHTVRWLLASFCLESGRLSDAAKFVDEGLTQETVLPATVHLTLGYLAAALAALDGHAENARLLMRWTPETKVEAGHALVEAAIHVGQSDLTRARASLVRWQTWTATLPAWRRRLHQSTNRGLVAELERRLDAPVATSLEHMSS